MCKKEKHCEETKEGCIIKVSDQGCGIPPETLSQLGKPFTQAEGASYHCQPLARELTEQRMFDWLDEHVA